MCFHQVFFQNQNRVGEGENGLNMNLQRYKNNQTEQHQRKSFLNDLLSIKYIIYFNYYNYYASLLLYKIKELILKSVEKIKIEIE